LDGHHVLFLENKLDQTNREKEKSDRKLRLKEIFMALMLKRRVINALHKTFLFYVEQIKYQRALIRNHINHYLFSEWKFIVI